MLWLYVALFITALIMGMLNVSQWVLIATLIGFTALSLWQSFYPILFEKDEKKIMKFLGKSKQAHYQFLYHFFNDDMPKAEASLQRIRSKRMQNASNLLLFTKKKQYTEVKALLPQMKDDDVKSYYSAVIAYEEQDNSGYEEYKGKIQDQDYVTWLEVEEKVQQGRKAEALAMLDEQLLKLKGLKRLSAVHYRKEIA
ncbi:hypothetical protein [Priestia abyssalis]|uniref:hypothetical protein n=1 Tax=Priestia abyssalis TaxID=1221450 RepID=UPI000995171B|nr:hypothetical protein [Priestia abyssalis]